MPSSVERALADALSLEHPDVPWTLPPSLPTKRELETAMTVLTVAPTDPKHAAFCLAKLMLAFDAGAKLSAEETKLRAATWLEANADLGNDLWSEATLILLRSWKRDDHYGRAPEPSDLRAAVDGKLADRIKKLQRCAAMLKALNGGDDTRPAEKPLATRAERLAHTRDAWKRLGNTARAASAERELAKEEGREPEDWARAVMTSAPIAKPDTPKLPPLGPAMQAATLRAVARRHREGGHTGYADQLVAKADALDPEFRDEPVDEHAAA